jgi:hypothetical protein
MQKKLKADKNKGEELEANLFRIFKNKRGSR